VALAVDVPIGMVDVAGLASTSTSIGGLPGSQADKATAAAS
jgi:hypothetical protein